MIIVFLVCGVGFILAGAMCGKDADMKDLDKEEVGKSALLATKNAAVKGASAAA